MDQSCVDELLQVASGKFRNLPGKHHVDPLGVQFFANTYLTQLGIRPLLQQVLDLHVRGACRRVGRYNEFALFQESRH
jgi:hypothetical protein